MITGVGISVHWRAGIAECQHYREGTAGFFLQATKLTLRLLMSYIYIYIHIYDIISLRTNDLTLNLLMWRKC